MFRLLKFIVAIGLILGLVAGYSYAGSRYTAGKVLGPRPTFMGQRRIELKLEGAVELQGNPRAWVYTYGPTQLPGVPTVKIYVTLNGKLIGTTPRDLAERIELYRNRDP